MLKLILHDPLLLIILVLLAATLYAYFAGLFSYPYGWLVLIAAAVWRMQNLRQN